MSTSIKPKTIEEILEQDDRYNPLLGSLKTGKENSDKVVTDAYKTTVNNAKERRNAANAQAFKKLNSKGRYLGVSKATVQKQAAANRKGQLLSEDLAFQKLLKYLPEYNAKMGLHGSGAAEASLLDYYARNRATVGSINTAYNQAVSDAQREYDLGMLEANEVYHNEQNNAMLNYDETVNNAVIKRDAGLAANEQSYNENLRTLYGEKDKKDTEENKILFEDTLTAIENGTYSEQELNEFLTSGRGATLSSAQKSILQSNLQSHLKNTNRSNMEGYMEDGDYEGLRRYMDDLEDENNDGIPDILTEDEYADYMRRADEGEERDAEAGAKAKIEEGIKEKGWTEADFEKYYKEISKNGEGVTLSEEDLEAYRAAARENEQNNIFEEARSKAELGTFDPLEMINLLTGDAISESQKNEILAFGVKDVFADRMVDDMKGKQASKIEGKYGKYFDGTDNSLKELLGESNYEKANYVYTVMVGIQKIAEGSAKENTENIDIPSVMETANTLRYKEGAEKATKWVAENISKLREEGRYEEASQLAQMWWG